MASPSGDSLGEREPFDAFPLDGAGNETGLPTASVVMTGSGAGSAGRPGMTPRSCSVDAACLTALPASFWPSRTAYSPIILASPTWPDIRWRPFSIGVVIVVVIVVILRGGGDRDGIGDLVVVIGQLVGGQLVVVVGQLIVIGDEIGLVEVLEIGLVDILRLLDVFVVSHFFVEFVS